MLLYNKKCFKKAPAVTAELIKMAQDFQGEEQGFWVGLAINMQEPFWLVPWLGGFGGKVFAEDGKTPTLNTPEMVKALQLMYDFKNTDKIMPQECDYACVDGLFKDGKAAMIINGDWSLGDYTGSSSGCHGHQEHRSGHGSNPTDHGGRLPQAVHGGQVFVLPQGRGARKSKAGRDQAGPVPRL